MTPKIPHTARLLDSCIYVYLRLPFTNATLSATSENPYRRQSETVSAGKMSMPRAELKKRTPPLQDALDSSEEHMRDNVRKEAEAANVGYVNASAQGLHNEIQGVQQSLTDDIKKVGAGAAALAGLHPQDYDPEDKWDFAVGYGNYRRQNASAVAAYYHPNEDTLINVGSTLGNGNNMVTAGVSFKFGPGGGTHTMSRTALTQENQELKKNVSMLSQGMTALHTENAALSEKNASLEEDVNDLKQLVAELHELQKEVKSHN